MAEPFVGLTPYEEVQAAYFFGRASERRVLVDNLLSSRLTLLYGESGTGKSSLLNAGVAHELRPEPEFVIVTFRTWRDDPRLGLADAIRKATGDTYGAPGAATNDLLKVIRQCAEAKGQSLLLLLDQFEEYFHYHPKQHEFDRDLARILTESDVPANLLIAIREDWLAALDRFKGRVPRLFDNYLRMQHLTRDGAIEAIEGPLKQYNLEHSNGHKVEWDPALPAHVIASILAGQTTVERGLHTADRVQAPYLQIVMQALWNADVKDGSGKLQTQTLDQRLRGAKHIYQNHLASTLAEKLTPGQRDAALGMFRHLVTGTGRKQTRTAQELSGDSGIDAGVVGPTLKTLCDARIISRTPPPRDAPPDDAGYEFAHDVLADAALSLIRHEAMEAEKAKRQEAEHRAKVEAGHARRLRYLLAALVLLLTVVIGLAIWASYMRSQAQVAANEAREQKQQAEKLRADAERQAQINRVRELIQTATATHLEGNNELAVLLASQAMNVARPLGEPLFEEAADALRIALIGVKPTGFDTNGIPLHVAVDPSGARVATITASEALDSPRLQVWRIGDAKPLREIETDINASIGWSADGRWLAVGNAGHDEVKVLDDATGKVIFDESNAEDAVAWHPSLPQLATGSEEDEVVIWSMPSGRALRRWKAHSDDITSISWSPDGERIATGSTDSYLRVWDVKTRRKVFEHKDVFERTLPTLAAIAWDEKGERLLTSDMGHATRVWSVSKDKSSKTIGILDTFSAWSNAGRWIVVSAGGASVKFLNGASLENEFQLNVGGAGLAMAWNRDDRALAISTWQAGAGGGSQGGTNRVNVYDTRSLKMSSGDLLAFARTRVKRSLTSAECKQHLRTDVCPARP